MGDHRLRRIDFPSSFRYTKHKQNAPDGNLFLTPTKSMIYNEDKVSFYIVMKWMLCITLLFRNCDFTMLRDIATFISFEK